MRTARSTKTSWGNGCCSTRKPLLMSLTGREPCVSGLCHLWKISRPASSTLTCFTVNSPKILRMELDKTTYLDLSIFNREDEYSLFHKLDFTTTSGGREYLRTLFSNPLKDIDAIHNRQQMLQFLLEKEDAWPPMITNGTIVVVENYLNAEIE